MTKFFLADAEAAVYAIEAAVCLSASVAAGDYGQAALDLVSLCGWIKNSITK